MKKKEMYPIRKNNYEEIMNKKLKEFYIIIHVVTVELLMGEGNTLEKSKIYMLYGIAIFGRKDIIGLYKENKDNSRYWLEEIEKIAKYTQYRWKATGAQELVRAYLSETE